MSVRIPNIHISVSYFKWHRYNYSARNQSAKANKKGSKKLTILNWPLVNGSFPPFLKGLRISILLPFLFTILNHGREFSETIPTVASRHSAEPA